MKTPISSFMIAAILGLSSFSLMAAAPEFLRLKDVGAEWEGKTKLLHVEIETAAAVPMDGNAGAFGYGALTDGTNNVLVLTTHLPIDDSSHEQAPSGFHTHVLDLKPPTPACPGASFEVDLVNSAKNPAFDANYAWSIKGNEVEVKKVPTTDLGDAGVENIVSFTIKPILDAEQKPTNLCITVVDKI